MGCLESKLLEFISHSTAKLSLLTNKIKRAYEKWSIINLEKRTDDGQGPMGISSDTNKSGVNTELYNQFETNYNNLSKKIRIISNLCVCSDNKCDNICGIDVEPEPIKEVYRRLSVSKPIRHMNQDVTCQLKKRTISGPR